MGVTGLPSDEAVLRAVVEHDGGHFDRVRRVTIGFSAVPSLIAGKVDAVVSFWNAEGVALRERGVDTREFRVDDYGAPRYPELVLAVTRETLDERSELVDSMLAALRKGTHAALRDRAATIEELVRVSGADEPLVRAQFAAVAPALIPPLRLDRDALEGWARFDARFGILRSAAGRAAGVPAALEHRLDERRGLARHARARHHALEAGRLGALAHVLLDVRVEAEPRQAGAAACLDAGVGVVGQVHHEQLGILAGRDGLMAGRSQRPLELRAEQQVGAEQRDARHCRYCARRRSNSWRTDSGRPHIWTTSTRPERASRSASSPSMPSASSSASVPRTVSGAAAWPNVCAERRRQCQSCSEYGIALICTSSVAASM